MVARLELMALDKQDIAPHERTDSRLIAEACMPPYLMETVFYMSALNTEQQLPTTDSCQHRRNEWYEQLELIYKVPCPRVTSWHFIIKSLRADHSRATNIAVQPRATYGYSNTFRTKVADCLPALDFDHSLRDSDQEYLTDFDQHSTQDVPVSDFDMGISFKKYLLQMTTVTLLSSLPLHHMSFKLMICLALHMGPHPVCAMPSSDLEHGGGGLTIGRMLERQPSSVWTVGLNGWPNTGYCAMVKFGVNRQQTFCLIVDTGSANTAVAATGDPALRNNEFYDVNLKGEDFTEMGKSVTVTYSSGEWSGYLVRDKIGFFGNFSMAIGPFALITSSTEFFIEGAEWVGILGLAYRSLAKPQSSVGTVWDSLREENFLRDVFALQLCPPKESTIFPGTFVEQGGSMTLGGVNNSLYKIGKPIYYTKIVKEEYYNILLTNISVGEKQINMSCKEFNNDKTIVDSGTTDIYFPTEVFQEVKNSFSDFFRGGVLDVPEEFWVGERKLLWQSAHIEEIYLCFPTLYLSMAVDEDSTQEFRLAVVPQVLGDDALREGLHHPSFQLYLRQIDVLAGEGDPVTCPANSPCNAFTFGVKPRAQGTIIGGNAMLGYYTVFDRENRRVGFAESTCEYRSTETAPYISGPYEREPEDCAVDVDNTRWDIITFFCGALTLLISLTMIVVTCSVRMTRSNRYRVTKRQKMTQIICKSGRYCCKMSGRRSNASDIVMLDTNCHSAMLPLNEEDSPNSMTISLEVSLNDRESSRDIAIVERETEMDNNTVIREGEKVKRKKFRRGNRWKKKQYPVMESSLESNKEVFCVASVSPVVQATTSHCASSYVAESNACLASDSARGSLPHIAATRAGLTHARNATEPICYDKQYTTFASPSAL